MIISGKDGLNILETTMQMSGRDESAPVECDICSKPLGKMKDVRTINWKKIVPGGFEPSSPAPKARRIDHYPTGLNPKS